ncbi:MAG: hypothetical protein A3D65_04775 [Candidatus Lloydbacteria bacterium RIFCSPHIGHO2_02_FULL_50_13]|uniref:Uncharacterized protein n=1 Tax=Candidatus Lloydbacteria bacterium RIFCSPHIGHO2_02_FULL_50_13 TaxID=1798661 RepID=A0A1G2DA36_9BACT|nr:MAG: hypothetical protein A3D65_04775 [Candidatus Lloydbacteria bacterium RIFCSPHIGHO2_02_FULL_50_13]
MVMEAAGLSPKIAVTAKLPVTITPQVPVPEQPPPDQPVNVYPAEGVAVRVTFVPELYVQPGETQFVLLELSAGEAETEPEPLTEVVMV